MQRSVPGRSRDKKMVCNTSPTLLPIFGFADCEPHQRCTRAFLWHLRLPWRYYPLRLPGDIHAHSGRRIPKRLLHNCNWQHPCTRCHYKPLRLHRFCLSQPFHSICHKQLRLTIKLRLKLEYDLHPVSQRALTRRNRRHRSWCRHHRCIAIRPWRILLYPRPQA